jgi:SPP1 gp7 family putative phage head morphogenesis protein
MAENDATRFKGYLNANAIDLARVEAGEVRSVLKTLEALEGDIAKVLATEKVSISKGQRIAEVRRAVEDAIDQGYSKVKTANQATLGKLAKVSHDSTVAEVNKAVGASVLNPVLTEKQLTKLASGNVVFGKTGSSGTAKVGQWWDGQRNDFKDKFARQIRLGYALGEDVGQISKRVMGNVELQFKDGISAPSKRNAETLVRSSIQNVSNEARLATYAGNADVVKGVEWLATLDDRTCPICRALDGLQWEMNADGSIGAAIGHSQPFPGAIAHFNCRCTQTSVTRSWDELNGNTPGTKTPPATPKQKPAADIPAVPPGTPKAKDVPTTGKGSKPGPLAPRTPLDPFPVPIGRKPKPGEAPDAPVPLPAKPNPQTISKGEGANVGGLTRGEFEKRVRAQMKKNGVDPENIDKAVVNARASMDGQVSDSKDFDQWLREQSKERRRRILGPSRLALFDKGVVTTRDMVDQSNRPLRVAELQKKVELGLFIAAETEGIRQAFKALEPGAIKPFVEPDIAARIEKVAAVRIEQALTEPEGNPLLAGELQKVLNEPGAKELSPSEVYARALAKTEALEAASRQANILRNARGRMIKGEKPTPSQSRVIEGLSPEERRNFDDWTGGAD